jgi:hypothetical protein
MMDGLTLFGLFAVTVMLVCYALEDHSHWFILGFAAACALGSTYGFLQGAWPFGLGRRGTAALEYQAAFNRITRRPGDMLSGIRLLATRLRRSPNIE